MKPHISENEAEIIANFAAEVISTLGLGRWRVLVMTDPSEKGTIATVDYVEDRYVAELRVSKDWVSRKSEEKYEAIIHECLHLLHLRVNQVLQDLEKVTLPHQLDTAWLHYTREIEYMVDRLATYVAMDSYLKSAWEKARVYNEAKD